MPQTHNDERALEKYDQEAEERRRTGARPGPTLLPGFIASGITTITGATSLGLRIGTKVGGWAIGGAREATLTSLEVSRAVCEAVLYCSARDIANRSRSPYGVYEAENILERSVSVTVLFLQTG